MGRVGVRVPADVPGSVMAAIAAAVAVVWEQPGAGFRIVAVRPAGARDGGWPPLWALAGRQAQMAARRMGRGRGRRV